MREHAAVVHVSERQGLTLIVDDVRVFERQGLTLVVDDVRVFGRDDARVFAVFVRQEGLEGESHLTELNTVGVQVVTGCKQRP